MRRRPPLHPHHQPVQRTRSSRTSTTRRRIFDAIGITVVLDESQLDAVTGLSGSGPAYVFLILEALADGGVKVGLSRRTAQVLAAQTLFGSAKLLLETNEHPGRLKDMAPRRAARPSPACTPSRTAACGRR
jgi:pyrroline-5-carboxylate reductase